MACFQALKITFTFNSVPILVLVGTVTHDHGAPHEHDVYSNGTLGRPRYT